MMLSHLFGIEPAPDHRQEHDPDGQFWLGYPYMIDLFLGLLKTIPNDLYETSAMDGGSLLQSFFLISFPLPIEPLMIASFAFNFNNSSR